MSSVELRSKAENTSPAGDEWLFTQQPDSPYTVEKMSIDTLVDYAAIKSDNVIGSTTRTERKYIPISASFPWFCLSLPDQTLSTTNYSTEFINEMRDKKITYDEMDTVVSSYSGSWSNNVFTLDDNAANNALLTALAQDWLFAGSPISNWRILNDGTTDFNITDIDVTLRQITVNLDGETTTGTSISIYLNRAYRSTTTCRHFSEAGLASYQAGSDKFNGLRRLDQMQGWQLGVRNIANTKTSYGAGVNDTLVNGGTSGSGNLLQTLDAGQGVAHRAMAYNDGTNGDPRTGSETRAKSSTEYKYIYTGSYTA